MGIRIDGLTLFNFRNYDHFSIDDVGGLTILIGQNGVGKTNVLEAVCLLTSCESFRNPHIDQLIKQDESVARVSISCTDEYREIQTVLTLEPGKKRYSVNGKSKALSEVKGVLPAVTFTPDDLEIAKKSSHVKRSSLDVLGGQLSRSYYVVQKDYEKAIRYKNRLIKDQAPSIMVESINDTLLVCGSQLACFRMALFNRMIPLVVKYYEKISQGGEAFSATYSLSWDHLSGDEGIKSNTTDRYNANGSPDRSQLKEEMFKSLVQFAEQERQRKRSLIGPHNDAISFFLDGKDVSRFASQGQQRSVVLAWKLAELEMIRNTLGISPVLLLDDVMSELDETRRQRLVEFVTDEIQTFITATDLDNIDSTLLERAKVIHLHEE